MGGGRIIVTSLKPLRRRKLRITLRILFGDVPEKLGHSHDLLPWERVSYVVLVALVFLVGFFPVPFLGMINAYTSASFPWLGGL